jgi:glycerol-3-phosphate dehydrogenase (NAD(P)+)
MTKIAVMGAGSWGTTFAKLLADAGNDVTVWSRRQEVADEINEDGRNGDYLPGINLPSELKATSSAAETLAGAEMVFIAVPSQSLRSNLEDWGPSIPSSALLVSLMKGVEKETGMRMSEVLADVTRADSSRIVVISGPNLSLEIAAEQPAAAVAACTDADAATRVAAASTNSYFTTFTNTDVIGTEFGGILKNLIAVAIGIVNGVGYGQNTKASIMTRGLAEISSFAEAFGADRATMVGLAGLGDLIATSESPLSRNHKAGEMLGKGYSLREVNKRLSQTAEGLTSVGPILRLARDKGVAMPIVEQVQAVLDGRMNPKDIAPHLTKKNSGPQGE